MPMPAPAGKAAVPQRHEQLHWPLAEFPAPMTMELPGAMAGGAAGGAAMFCGGDIDDVAGGREAGEAAGGGGGGGEAAGGAAAGGGMAAAGIVDAGIILDMLLLIAMAASAVPFCCMAICINISGVLSAVGLILKVMPFPQWLVGFFCLQ